MVFEKIVEITSQGLLNVTASHVHCKCGNISETVLVIASLLLQTDNSQ